MLESAPAGAADAHSRLFLSPSSILTATDAPSLDELFEQVESVVQRGPEGLLAYVVKPDGDIEPDPDCKVPGGSFACQRAKVIAIKKIPGKIIKKHRKAIIRNMHQLDAAKKAKQT